MKAACWEGRWSVDVQQVDDPAILNPHDLIMRITHTTICGTGAVGSSYYLVDAPDLSACS